MNEKSFLDTNVLIYTEQSHCEILLTEDLQAGQEIEGKLKIVNPFSK